MTYWLLPFTLPSIVLGHLWGGLMLCGFAKHPRYDDGVLTVIWRPWVASRWKYSTTIGHCICMHPWHGSGVRYHEGIHILQYEDLCLLGAAIGGSLCAVSWKVGLVVWATSGAPWLLLNFVSGWIRFDDPYRGSEHERSAYAQTAQHAEGRQ